MNSRCRHEKYEKKIPLHHLSIYFRCCLYLFRVFSILFIHLLIQGWQKIHESLMDLFRWIFCYSFIPGCSSNRGRNIHHLLPSHRLKFHSSLCRLRYWSKLKYLKKFLRFADLKHFSMLWKVFCLKEGKFGYEAMIKKFLNEKITIAVGCPF